MSIQDEGTTLQYQKRTSLSFIKRYETTIEEVVQHQKDDKGSGCSSLGSSCRIEDLNISKNMMTNKSGLEFAEMLKVNSWLQKVSFAWNDI